MEYKYTYKNPFYKSSYQNSLPEYSTNNEPIKYKNHLIFQRQAEVFDIVKDNICISMYAGINGAKKFIDNLLVKGE